MKNTHLLQNTHRTHTQTHTPNTHTQIAETQGCTVSHWQPRTSPTQHAIEFHTDDLAQCMQPNTKLVVVNFPHNPTGAVACAQQWRRIIELCRERDAYLFSDEVGEHFVVCLCVMCFCDVWCVVVWCVLCDVC